jgi:D-alanine transaminase
MSNLIQGVYQGSFMPLDEIRVSPLSRAYTFSDSIYEVIPYYNGKPLCLDEHIDRFKVSAAFLKIELDFSVVKKEIEELGKTVESYSNAYVYYQISRGVDTLRSHIVKDKLVPERFGYADEVKLSSDPILAKLNQDNRWANCHIKTTSLLGNVLNMNDAYRDGCNETILVRNDKIVEGGACNIFMTYENEIYTPSLEENILPGVTREFFISSLEKKDIIVKEADCPVSFLDSVSTIWFTSSTRGVQPIKSILNHDYKMDPEDTLFKNAKEAFTNSIKDYFQDH